MPTGYFDEYVISVDKEIEILDISDKKVEIKCGNKVYVLRKGDKFMVPNDIKIPYINGDIFSQNAQLLVLLVKSLYTHNNAF